MAIGNEFNDMFSANIRHTRWSGYDEYGTPEYGAAETHKGHLVFGPKLVRGNKGEEITSAGRVYLDTVKQINPKDKLEIISDETLSPATDTELHIVKTDYFYDEDSAHHIRIFFV